MSHSCPPAPTDKKGYVAEMGKILTQDYGKKKYYTPEEVKKSHRKSKWYEEAPGALDFSCWGMSTFCSHEDFDRYHEQAGELCDYVGMKKEMVQGLAADEGWLDFMGIDLDGSWLDFGDLFEGVVDGIGDFISGILEGL